MVISLFFHITYYIAFKRLFQAFSICFIADFVGFVFQNRIDKKIKISYIDFKRSVRELRYGSNAKRLFLIRASLDEQPRYRNTEITLDESGQKHLLRGLMNVRTPRRDQRRFFKIQDEYLFPQKEAAQIAVQTVKDFKQQTGSLLKVIFNVFKDDDLEIYKSLLV